MSKTEPVGHLAGELGSMTSESVPVPDAATCFEPPVSDASAEANSWESTSSTSFILKLVATGPVLGGARWRESQRNLSATALSGRDVRDANRVAPVDDCRHNNDPVPVAVRRNHLAAQYSPSMESNCMPPITREQIGRQVSGVPRGRRDRVVKVATELVLEHTLWNREERRRGDGVRSGAKLGQNEQARRAAADEGTRAHVTKLVHHGHHAPAGLPAKLVELGRRRELNALEARTNDSRQRRCALA